MSDLASAFASVAVQEGTFDVVKANVCGMIKELAPLLRVIATEEPLIGGFADAVKALLSWPRRPVELQTTRSL